MTAETTIDGLRDYLRGFLSHPGSSELIESRDDWQALAQAELDRRAARFLSSLPDDELRLLARGEADLKSLANEQK